MKKTNYQISTSIRSNIEKVFEAVVDDTIICQYFADKSSGPLKQGETIVWHWTKWGDYPVKVIAIEPNRSIHLTLDSRQWRKTDPDGYSVNVIFRFEENENSQTVVSVSESGWRQDEPGYIASHENCSGWTHMTLCLKAFLEHGVDLRSE